MCVVIPQISRANKLKKKKPKFVQVRVSCFEVINIIIFFFFCLSKINKVEFLKNVTWFYAYIRTFDKLFDRLNRPRFIAFCVICFKPMRLFARFVRF